MNETENTTKALEEELEQIQALKESNPDEYVARLKDYIDSLKEFNDNAKKLLGTMTK